MGVASQFLQGTYLCGDLLCRTVHVAPRWIISTVHSGPLLAACKAVLCEGHYCTS